jgi:hypothetical protein
VTAPTPLPAHRSTRPIAVGPFHFVVVSDDADVTRRFDRLLAAFPESTDPSAPTVVVLLEHRRDPSGVPTGLFDSEVEGEVIAQGVTLADQEFRISRRLNQRKLDGEPDLLHVHSAAVARDGAAVLLVGKGGSGKSTLTAALVRAGWQYVTDEIVSARPANGRVVAYPRPITLRKGVWSCFPELAPFPDTPLTENEGARVEVAPLDLGTAVDFEPRVRAVVFPRYTTDAPAGLERIATVAECVEDLAASCHDLERLGATGVQQLAEWAALGAAWRLDFSDLDEAIEHVDEAFAAARDADPVVVEHVPAGVEGTLAPGTLRRAPDAHAWRFGDGSAVVYRPKTLQLGRIDAMSLEMWSRLRAPTTLDALTREFGGEDPAICASLEFWVQRLAVTEFIELADEEPSS